jgi:hypothetical protein
MKNSINALKWIACTSLALLATACSTPPKVADDSSSFTPVAVVEPGGAGLGAEQFQAIDGPIPVADGSSESNTEINFTIQAQPSSDASRRSAAQQAYSTLIHSSCTAQQPSSSDLDYWVRQMRNGISVEQLWTAVGISAKRDACWGFFAPVRGHYDTPSSNPDGRVTSNQCWGAVGSNCDGVSQASISVPRYYGGFTRADGVSMIYIKMETSIGSIVHDMACLNVGSKGHWCNGPTSGWNDILGLPRAWTPAAHEWGKAFWNTRNKRVWVDWYGPYPDPRKYSSLFKQYSDDLRQVARRSNVRLPALFIPGGGAIFMPPLTADYIYGETPSTRRLRAPTATAMDTSDAAFCASGRFSNSPLPGGYGICQ